MFQKVDASGIQDFAHQKTLQVRDRLEYLRQIGAENSSLTIAMMKSGARSPKASVKSIFGLDGEQDGSPVARQVVLSTFLI